MGDVSNDSIKNQVTGEKYEAFRDAHAKGEFYKYPFCDGCDQLNKKEDVLVYTNIRDVKIGSVNTSYEELLDPEETRTEWGDRVESGINESR